MYFTLKNINYRLIISLSVGKCTNQQEIKISSSVCVCVFVCVCVVVCVYIYTHNYFYCFCQFRIYFCLKIKVNDLLIYSNDLINTLLHSEIKHHQCVLFRHATVNLTSISFGHFWNCLSHSNHARKYKQSSLPLSNLRLSTTSKAQWWSIISLNQ